jgi:hypothetical protein
MPLKVLPPKLTLLSAMVIVLPAALLMLMPLAP